MDGNKKGPMFGIEAGAYLPYDKNAAPPEPLTLARLNAAMERMLSCRRQYYGLESPPVAPKSGDAVFHALNPCAHFESWPVNPEEDK